MRNLILLTLLGSACAAPKSVNRIVGGDDTTIEDYPFMVNLQYAITDTHWTQRCGGSLLNTRSVLSAAHCFEGERPSLWRAILGSTYASGGKGSSIHPVSEYILHPQYNTPVMDNNVAIVHLSVPAVYSDTVQPARIAGWNYNLPDGTQVTSIGWGAYLFDTISSDILQDVDVKLINHEECAWRYMFLKKETGFENWPDVSSGMLCAGILDKGGKGTCRRDDGGPLVHEGDVVVGITSWRYKCGDEHYPDVYTRVSHYVDWIVANA